MEQIQQLMKDDIEKLNQIIINDLSSNIMLINQISNYIIVAGGKRIRPLLVLLSGRLAGGVESDLLYKMAAMIEYIHTATLLHDDVVDESGMRRGRKTSNAVFGNAASVLVGDFIYTRAFQLMVEADSLRLLRLMADSTNQISEGEVLQLLNIGRSDLTEDEYYQVIKHKTAVLFEAGARVAAIIANAPKEQEEALADYAVSLGTAFQIVDDILDYFGDSNVLGKNIGDDLEEGKVTLPLIYILKYGTVDDIKIIKEAINNPHQIKNINKIIEIVKQSQAIDYCKNLANQHIKKAINSLSIFPDCDYRQAMIRLAELSLERIN